MVVQEPELVPAAIATCPDRTVWDVHEDATAALADKPWLPRRARPARRAVHRLERAAEQRLWLILAEPAYTERFTRPHPVIANLPWVPDQTVAPDQRRVVALGRISCGRGFDQLLALADRLPADVSVELIGQADIDVQPRLEAAHAAGAVRWTGFVPNDQTLARIDGATTGLSLLALADTPNYRQSLPTKVVEYLVRGVPVVTTNPQAATIVRDAPVCELAIRDLKAEGLAHSPSGIFNTNAAWLVLATLAHNVARWTARLGSLADGALVAKTLRRRHLAVPGRLTRTGRRWRLALPARWPWREAFLTAVERIRALPSLAPG